LLARLVPAPAASGVVAGCLDRHPDCLGDDIGRAHSPALGPFGLRTTQICLPILWPGAGDHPDQPALADLRPDAAALADDFADRPGDRPEGIISHSRACDSVDTRDPLRAGRHFAVAGAVHLCASYCRGDVRLTVKLMQIAHQPV